MGSFCLWIPIILLLIPLIRSGTELGEGTGTTQQIVVVEDKTFFHWLGVAALIVACFLFFFMFLVPAIATAVIRYRCEHSPCSIYSVEKPKTDEKYGRVFMTKKMAKFGAPQSRSGFTLKIDGILIMLTILSGRVLECFSATVGVRKELFEIDLNKRIGGQMVVNLPNKDDVQVLFGNKWRTEYCDHDQQLRPSCNGTCSGMIFTFNISKTTSLGDIGGPVLYDCQTKMAMNEPRLEYKRKTGSRKKRYAQYAGTRFCETGNCDGRIVKAGDPTCKNICPGPCKHTQWTFTMWCYQAAGERKMFLDLFKRINAEILQLNTRLGDAEVRAVINEGRLNVTQYRMNLTERLVNSEIKDLKVDVFKNFYLSVLAEQREVKKMVQDLFDEQLRNCRMMTPEFLVKVNPSLFNDTVVAQAYLNVGEFECLYDPKKYRLSVSFSTPRILDAELYSVLETLPHNIKESETTCSVGLRSLTAIRLRDGLRQPWGNDEILARTVGVIQKTSLVSSGSANEIDPRWKKLLDNEIFVHPELTGTTFDSKNCPRFQIFWSNEFALVISLMQGVVVSGKDYGKGVTLIQYTSEQILFQIGLETFKTPLVTSDVNITLTLYSKETWEAFVVSAGRVIAKSSLKMDRSSLSEKLLVFKNHTTREVSKKVDEYKKVTLEAQESLMKIQSDIEEEQNKTWKTANVAMAMGTGAVGSSSAVGCCFCIVCLFVIFKVVKKLLAQRYGSSYTHNYATPTLSIVRNIPDMMWIFSDKIIETRSILANVVIFISWKFLPNLQILMKLRIIPVGSCIPRKQGEIEGPGGIEMSETSRDPGLIRKFGRPGKNKVAPMGNPEKCWDNACCRPKEECLVEKMPILDPCTTYEYEEEVSEEQHQRVKISEGDLMIRDGSVWAVYNDESPYMMGGFTWHAEGNTITNGFESLTEKGFETKIMSGGSP